ncbi:hypothetical protein CEXT_651331 [Caerostris extrusa]|uniref:Uncharacterized protein n=1 Tax=Caerostris extrusa TaxID=172846 RepID=A0AAV4TAS1_CAEEX|nr:hypothetical protein CEXT_651331 [Caerostris extrusa]
MLYLKICWPALIYTTVEETRVHGSKHGVNELHEKGPPKQKGRFSLSGMLYPPPAKRICPLSPGKPCAFIPRISNFVVCHGPCLSFVEQFRVTLEENTLKTLCHGHAHTMLRWNVAVSSVTADTTLAQHTPMCRKDYLHSS